MAVLRIALCMAGLVWTGFAQHSQPARGYVPDAATATKIAEAVLISIYGKAVLADRPFKAALKDGIWTISGTRHCQENLPGPKFCSGGEHWVRLAKGDGRILEVQPEYPATPHK